MKKVVICTPTRAKPHKQYLISLEECVPVLEAAGWASETVFEIGCPYISHARSKALYKAMESGADAVVFIDDDLSWTSDGILRLLQIEDEVVAGTYRFKKDEPEYMGALMTDDEGFPVAREDGCLEAFSIPAGFLKITRSGVNRFMRAYPELCYGGMNPPHVDLFNHGAFGGVWWGEDYAFARRWREKCGKIWLIPDLYLDHHDNGGGMFPGNFHNFLLRQPGGSEAL